MASSRSILRDFPSDKSRTRVLGAFGLERLETSIDLEVGPGRSMTKSAGLASAHARAFGRSLVTQMRRQGRELDHVRSGLGPPHPLHLLAGPGIAIAEPHLGREAVRVQVEFGIDIV